jgi:hypothetical protein
MAASSNIHRMQMKLFVDPEEHINKLRGSVDLFPDESWTDLWDNKAQEAAQPLRMGNHGAGVKQSIAEEGFRPHGAPTLYAADDLSGFVQGEGHHRMAASRELQRESGQQRWVPVNYSSSYMSANRFNNRGPYDDPPSTYRSTPS